MTTASTASRKVFRGPNALWNYLTHFEPPLVALPRKLNPYYDDVEILVSLASQTPFANGKFCAVYGMLEAAQKAGDLEGVEVLVEGSSGNTVAVLPVLAAHYGIDQVKAIVPADLVGGKDETLTLQGVSITKHQSRPGGETAADVARREGKLPGHLNLGQYENEANPEANRTILAPLLDHQTDGEVAIIAAALGTTGMALGLQRYFGDRATVVGVMPEVSEPKQEVPGMRDGNRIKEVRFDWKSEIKECVTVRRHESFLKAARLFQEGLLAGPSSGAAYVGLLRFIAKEKDAGTLGRFRKGSEGKVVAVVICPDGPGPYLPLYKAELSTDELARQ